MPFLKRAAADAELAILAVLWRQGASTVREVYEALGKDSCTARTTRQLAHRTAFDGIELELGHTSTHMDLSRTSLTEFLEDSIKSRLKSRSP